MSSNLTKKYRFWFCSSSILTFKETGGTVPEPKLDVPSHNQNLCSNQQLHEHLLNCSPKYLKPVFKFTSVSFSQWNKKSKVWFLHRNQKNPNQKCGYDGLDQRWPRSSFRWCRNLGEKIRGSLFCQHWSNDQKNLNTCRTTEDKRWNIPWHDSSKHVHAVRDERERKTLETTFKNHNPAFKAGILLKTFKFLQRNSR